RTFAAARGRAKHRPDESGRLLPQLPGQVVSGRGGTARCDAGPGAGTRLHLWHALFGLEGVLPDRGRRGAAAAAAVDPASARRYQRRQLTMHDVDVVSGRAQRLHAIRPFHVMGLLRRAHELEAAGRHIVHMEIGEPDFATAEPVVAAGVRALRAGRTHYLPAAGLPELREAIAAHYAQRYGVEVPSERIFITPGASGALTLAAALTMNPGSDMLLPEPGYPCNRNFVALVNGRPVALPVQAQADYQPTVAAVEAAITPSTAALLLASPSNPTGTMLDAERLAQLGTCAHNREMALIVDEIYHGLHYDAEPASAVQHAPNALVVNSFSKYFGMTGWRLGWLVVPQGWEADTEKLIQNLFINASTPAQYAALACFTEPAQAIFEARREAFRERRDFLLPA